MTLKRIEESLGPNNIKIYKTLSATFWHLTSFLISDSETQIPLFSLIHGSQLLIFMLLVWG